MTIRAQRAEKLWIACLDASVRLYHWSNSEAENTRLQSYATRAELLATRCEATP